jgi:hypothetical protein
VIDTVSGASMRRLSRATGSKLVVVCLTASAICAPTPTTRAQLNCPFEMRSASTLLALSSPRPEGSRPSHRRRGDIEFVCVADGRQPRPADSTGILASIASVRMFNGDLPASGATLSGPIGQPSRQWCEALHPKPFAQISIIPAGVDHRGGSESAGPRACAGVLTNGVGVRRPRR